MEKKFIFGKINNNRKYVYIKNNQISIKSGGLALFGDKFLTEEIVMKKENIKNIEIIRPTLKSGTMKFFTSSGKEISVEIATMQQYKDAIAIKDYIYN